jgi:uncharacterized membrane protein
MTPEPERTPAAAAQEPTPATERPTPPDTASRPAARTGATAAVRSALDRRPLPALSEADRRAARHLLGAIFIAAGIAHLTHQRFYRSLLPYWLLEARREMDVATGIVEVFGGALLFMPKLRTLARWTNLAVLTPELLAAIGEVRRPARLRPFSHRAPGLEPLGPLVLAPGHAGLAGLLWWATKPDRGGAATRTTARSVSAGS